MDLTEEKQDQVFHQLVYILSNKDSPQIFEKFNQLKIQESQQNQISKVSSDQEKQQAIQLQPNKDNQISVIKEPPSKISDKIETEYFIQGIQNYGQSCYFSSVIQILRIIYFQSSLFQQIILNLKDKSLYIKSLFDLIAKKSELTIKKIQEFYDLLNSNSFYVDGQPRDCSILFSTIISKIRSIDTNVNNVFKSQFCIQQDNFQKVYKNCCYNPLWLQISDDYYYIEDCISSFIEQNSGFYQKLYIVKDPEFIILSVQRVKRSRVKLSRKLEFTKYENQTISKVTYSLKGFIVGPKHNYVVSIVNDKEFIEIDDQNVQKIHENLYQYIQLAVYKKCSN